MNIKIVVIGSGFAGLSAAALLAHKGFEVNLFEKNKIAGGRASIRQQDGFTFDTGPSWYWMPEVFENYFNIFGKKASDFYELIRLNPAYRIYWGENDLTDIPAEKDKLLELFEQLENKGAEKLNNFLAEAAYKYEKAMSDYVFRPSIKLSEYFEFKLLKESLKLQMFTSLSSHVRKYFSNERLIKILEFPVLFLGGTPQNTPALYSLMNHADLTLGTWYPKGGMYKVVEAINSLAEGNGVNFYFNSPVEKIVTKNGKATGIISNGQFHEADVVLSGADYHHSEQMLLESDERNYSTKYWESRVLSPSCLIFLIGINKKLTGIKHHTLFFDEDFNRHSREIYSNPKWPEKPLFYLSAPSQTDSTTAPENYENLFFLIPVAPGLEDNEIIREKYFEMILKRFAMLTGEDISGSVVLKRSYSIKDFAKDYNSFKGNAYGLANILKQTAVFKPKLRSKKIDNLFFTGQLTVPGPGVPPSIISGQVSVNEILKYLNSEYN